MENYELMLIFDPEISEEKRKSILTKIGEFINKNEGKVKRINDWGKRILSYQIRRKKEGFYCLLEIEMTPKTAKEISGKINVEEDIIRYLLIKKS